VAATLYTGQKRKCKPAIRCITSCLQRSRGWPRVAQKHSRQQSTSLEARHGSTVINVCLWVFAEAANIPCVSAQQAEQAKRQIRSPRASHNQLQSFAGRSASSHTVGCPLAAQRWEEGPALSLTSHAVCLRVPHGSVPGLPHTSVRRPVRLLSSMASLPDPLLATPSPERGTARTAGACASVPPRQLWHSNLSHYATTQPHSTRPGLRTQHQMMLLTCKCRARLRGNASL
jgi:hypothetical protein